jgi:hypothetical protein
METRHSNARLSIYGMGDTPVFVIKEDAHAFVMKDGMGYATAFVIKEDALPLLSDVTASYFYRLKMINLIRIFDPYLLIEFLK